MPFKMHKIIFFPEKKYKKIFVPTYPLPETFGPSTSSTQDDWKLSQHNGKIVDWEVNHQQTAEVYMHDIPF